MKVVVLGGGVSGLTCGLVLARSGREVEVWAERRWAQTVSSVAAALWYPYAVQPIEAAARWAFRSYDEFERIAADPAAGARAGVVMRAGIEVAAGPLDLPEWLSRVREGRPARPDELPTGYTAGFVFRAPVIETRVYLPWLEHQLARAGGRLVERTAATLEEALEQADVVIHCSGLAARELLGDREVYPARGQILRVAPCGIDEFVLDEHERQGLPRVTYIVPRSEDVVLGGTFEPHVEEVATTDEQTAAILERCARLRPELRGARVLERKAGLRPCRSAVRLELERRPGGRAVVHDYGHGGAGVTLSWGCALEVAERVDSLEHASLPAE